MLKPNQKRSKIAITLIWICLIVYLFSFFSSFLQYRLLTQISIGIQIADDILEQNDVREQLIMLVTFIVNIISAVTFIQWFRRAYFNLHSLVPNLTFTEGWAAGSWFVPMISFFRPFQIMVELYNKTIEKLEERKLIENQNFDISFLKLWWALWILVFVIDLKRLVISRSDMIDSLKQNTIIDMFQCLVYIPLSLLTIKVIKEYSNFENILFNDIVIEPALHIDSENKDL
jgi:hypothetical protein